MALTRKEIDAFTSSKNLNWETPPYIFNDLHKRFKFTVDGAADKKNALLKKYWNDSLNKNWDRNRVFINPPYGDMVPLFAEKCAQSKNIVVALLPSRPGTVWFQDLVLEKAVIFFVRGRIQFWLNGKVPIVWCKKTKRYVKQSPLFDSVIAIYNHPKYRVGTGIYLKPRLKRNTPKPIFEPGVLKLILGHQTHLLL